MRILNQIIVSASILLFSSTALTGLGTGSQLVLETGGHVATPRGLAFSADGAELVSVGDDKTIRIWDADRGGLKRVFHNWAADGPEGSLQAVAVDPQGGWLACGGYTSGGATDYAVRLIDFMTGAMRSNLRGHVNPILSLAVSADGRWLASSDVGGEVKLWAMPEGRLVDNFICKQAMGVRGLAFDPQSTMLAVAGASGMLELFDLQNGTSMARREAAHEKAMEEVAWSPDGRCLVTVGDDGKIKLWSAPGLEDQGILYESGAGTLFNVAFLDADTVLAGGINRIDHNGNMRNPVVIVNRQTKKVRTFWSHTNSIQDIVVSPRGRLVASTGDDLNQIRLWDSKTLSTQFVFHGGGSPVYALEWDKETQTIFWGSQNAKLFEGEGELEQGFRVVERELTTEVPAYLAGQRMFHELDDPDEPGTLAISPSDPGILLVGKRSLHLPVNSGCIRTASYTRNGKSILVGCDTGLYQADTYSLQIRRYFRVPSGGVWALREFDDGKTVAAGGLDEVIRFFDLSAPIRPPELQPWDWFSDRWKSDLKKYFPSYDLTTTDGMKSLWTVLGFSRDTWSWAWQLLKQAPVVLPLACMYAGEDGEWAVWTPEGYFDGSPKGIAAIGAIVQTDDSRESVFRPVQAGDASFDRPGLLRLALSPEARNQDMRLEILVAGDPQAARKSDVGGEPPRIVFDSPIVHASISGIAVSPDGTYVATFGFDRCIKIHETSTGMVVKTIRFAAKTNQDWFGFVNTVAFDPSGRFLAVGGDFESDNNQRIQVFRIDDCQMVASVRIPRGKVNKVEWVLKGRNLLVQVDLQTGWSQLNTIDTKTWTVIRRFESAKEDPMVSFAVSPDSAKVAVLGVSGKLEIRDYQTGNLVDTSDKLVRDRKTLQATARWSPDGRYVGVAERSADLTLFDAHDLVKSWQLAKVGTENFAFLSAQSIAYAGETSIDTTSKTFSTPLYKWDFVKGKETRLALREGWLEILAASADGSMVAASCLRINRDHELCLVGGDGTGLRVAGGTLRINTELAVEGNFAAVEGDVWSFDLKNKRVLPGKPGLPKALAEKDGKKVTKMDSYHLEFDGRKLETNGFITAFGFSPDARGLFVATSTDFMRFLPATMEVEIHYNKDNLVGSYAFAFNEKARVVVSSEKDGTIRFWNARASGKRAAVKTYDELLANDPEGFEEFSREFHEIQPDMDLHKEEDREAFFEYMKNLVPDETDTLNWLLSKDNEIEYTNPSPLLSLFVAPDGEWIAWTPEGYYDCSLDGAKYAGWLFDRGPDKAAEYFALEQYASWFYRPDVIDKALDMIKRNLPQVDFDNRPPRITSFKINGNAVFDEDEITITTDRPEFTIELSSSGTTALRQPEVFYNGRVISQGKFKGAPAVKLSADRQSLTASYTFNVSNPDNRYKIYTIDERGFKSAAKRVHVVYTGKDASPAFYKLGEKITPPRSMGTLYVLSIGVNSYSNPGMAAAGMGNLAYAEKDAADMAGLWVGQQGKLFDKVETIVLTKEKLGRDVTQADIMRAFSVLGTKATRDTDSVLVFMSGHGLRKDSGFYFLSSEADPTTKQSLDATSPSWIAIGDKLKTLTRVKEIVVLVDACHSGAINPTELGFTWKDKGVVLVTSSRAGQKSYEGGSYLDDRKQKSVFENGLFTQAIMEGFGYFGTSDAVSPAGWVPADSSQDNVLIVGEVLDYAIRKVGQWTNEQQTPWAPAYDPAIEGKVLGVVK